MGETDVEHGGDATQPPSKSARKRAAHAAQKLGERLVRLREADLDALPLHAALREAIGEARRLGSRGALARQYQYIGRLMRGADIASIEAALAALDEARKARARLGK